MRYADKFGFYELNPLPGCNQVVVSNHALIYKEHRGKGIGQIQHHERLEKARELGYDLMLCTVKADNEAEKHILNKMGWAHLTSFSNTETGNTVELWSKML